MEVEFVNMYIERLVKEVEELTKSRLLNEARLNYIEFGNQKLIQKIEELEKLIEKQNKKKVKEVDTSENF